mgnify:FL=1
MELARQVDLVYVCGCFNDYAINTLIANRLGKIKVPVIVAAMGLFSPKEFQLKYLKKKTFTTIFNLLGMFKNIYWSATSEMEISEIKKQVVATDKQFFIAEDLPRKVNEENVRKEKKAGSLKIVWISRIAPKKNLKYAIEILKEAKSNIKFTIYGPVHVQEYWEECKQELRNLPNNVKWEWKGNLDSENVVETLKLYDVFLFPTLGENFGHVIQEALSAGCPCIISNQTPWQDFESKGVGYVFLLENKSAFVNAVEKYAVMEQSEFQKVTEKVHQYAIEVSNNKAKNTGYRDIFNMNWK